ncbi:MAG: NAD(P)/FAD-dependent oxidoreductase [Rhizomicrobium sp.]
MARACDFLVIGGGMAGVSCGHALAKHGRVTVLEREAHAGTQATGRSAALYLASYGNAVVRQLNRVSRTFFDRLPDGFSETPILTPRGCLNIALPEDMASLDELERASPDCLRRVGRDEILAMVPILRPEYAATALFEEGGADIDVDALLQGYLRGMKRAGGELVTNAAAAAIARANGTWTVEAGNERYTAPVLVNAAGAWADEIARLAGAAPIGLRAMRRTVALADAPKHPGFAKWPAVADVAGTFYFKPDAGRLLISPADETPSPPVVDVADDEDDVRLALHRYAMATTETPSRPRHSWAGLRTFTPDRAQAIGFAEPGFFWLAGQGGYGIQSAPAAAQLAAALIAGLSLPDIDADALSPRRFSTR